MRSTHTHHLTDGSGALMVLLSILMFTMSACKRQQQVADDVLLRIDDKELSKKEVLEKIPAGLYPGDSARLFQEIVDSWVRDELLTEFASDRLTDLDHIERKVNDYRSKLIIEEYLRKMTESHEPAVNEEDIKRYYDVHRKDIKTEMPLVKGVIVKINKDSKGKNEISRLIREGDDKSLEKFENEWIYQTISYDYFKDRWIEWERVKELLPYNSLSPNDTLSESSFFTTEDSDFIYMLKITDYIEPGSEQPYEYAEKWIRRLLTHIDLNNYENSLVNNLIIKSIEEKKMEIINYDPIEKKWINK